MTTNASDDFNAQSLLRSLASRLALRTRRTLDARFVALAGTAPGRRRLDLGAPPATNRPDSHVLERRYAHRAAIAMASSEDCPALETIVVGTRCVQMQPDRPLPFPNAHFAVGCSRAVLEHVGGGAQQRFVFQELLHTCRSGFVTTPDRAGAIAVHTCLPVVHWLSKRVHRRVLRWLGRSFWAEEAHVNLLTQRALAQLVTEALPAKDL